MNDMMNDKWIGIEEAAEYLGIKPITVRDWIKKDTGIPAHKKGTVIGKYADLYLANYSGPLVQTIN